jgi:hypothetical protein
VTQPATEPYWPAFYFVTGSADHEFFATQVGVSDRQDAEELRTAVMVALARKRTLLVIHGFNDELEMARWCEAIWPGERTRGIRAAIEAERQAGGRRH